jgi:4-aminobutyrate aminotransferase-like enzyme
MQSIRNHIPRGLIKNNNIVVARGKGCQVWDAEGRQYLDLTAGIGALSTGHCHPKVVAAVTEQVKTLGMGQQNCFLSHPQHLELTERLLKLMPVPEVLGSALSSSGASAASSESSSSSSSSSSAVPSSGGFARSSSGQLRAARGFSSVARDPLEYQNAGNLPLDTFFFTNSGSESTENAIKIARMATGKPNIIAVKGGFHGRTLGATSLTSSKVSYRYGFQPLMPGCFISDCTKASVDDLLYGQTGPGETCAVIVEPIQGEAGVTQVDFAFMRYLRKVCTEHNILLILDEVQSGVARSGAFWSCELSGVVPDVMTFAKGISSGYPVGGVACSGTLTDRMGPNSVGGTGGGNPVCLAAANATLEVIEEEGLVEKAVADGTYLLQGLERVKQAINASAGGAGGLAQPVGDIRQYGLFCAVDIDAQSLAPVPDIVARAAEKHGLVLIGCGRNALRISPPLVITRAELDFFFERLEKTLREFLP